MTAATKTITAVVPMLASPRAAVPRQIMPLVMAAAVTAVPRDVPVAPREPLFCLVAVAVGVGLPCVVVAPGGVAHQPGLAQDDDRDNRHGEGPAEPVLPRLQQGHVEVEGDEGEEPHRLHPRGPGRKPLEQRRWRGRGGACRRPRPARSSCRAARRVPRPRRTE